MDGKLLMDSLTKLRSNANAARGTKDPTRRRKLEADIGLAQLEPEIEVGQAELEHGPQIEMGEAQIDPSPTVRIGPTQYDDDIRARIGPTRYERR